MDKARELASDVIEWFEERLNKKFDSGEYYDMEDDLAEWLKKRQGLTNHEIPLSYDNRESHRS